MFPGGINPRQMKQMMKRMGISSDEIEANVVIINCVDKDIVIENPQVTKMVVQGQNIFQVIGDVKESEIESKVEIEEEDVKMVAEQSNVSEDEARKALEDSKGDIAEAIMKLKG